MWQAGLLVFVAVCAVYQQWPRIRHQIAGRRPVTRVERATGPAPTVDRDTARGRAQAIADWQLQQGWKP